MAKNRKPEITEATETREVSEPSVPSVAKPPADLARQARVLAQERGITKARACELIRAMDPAARAPLRGRQP